MTQSSSNDRPVVAYVVMCLTPLFFSSNLVFGRSVNADVAPFTLALIRWGAVAIALSPFVVGEWRAVRELVGDAARLVFLLGFLGMWICGAIVYLGLHYTTATNGTLIYTASPVIIVALEALFAGRRVGLREIAGIAIAVAGVLTIILRGSLDALLALSFNTGDLLIAGAAVSWSVYSLLYRDDRLSAVSNLALFSLIAGAGALLLLPFAAFEFFTAAPMPVSRSAWSNIAGIVVFSSLLAFSGYQFGLRALGPSTTGVFMYLLPPYGVFLAVLLLGEAFLPYHLVGIALVMAGVILATLRNPARRGRERTGST